MEKIDICALTPDVFWKLNNVEAPLNANEPDTTFLYAALYHATNMHRTQHGLPRLLYSNLLKKAATLHCNEMKKHKFFAHNNPYNPALKNVFDRVHAAGGTGTFTIVGENIADFPLVSYTCLVTHKWFMLRKKTVTGTNHTESYKTMALKIVDAWMKSKGHRRNILNKSYRYVGFGMALHKKSQNDSMFDYLLCAQNFGG